MDSQNRKVPLYLAITLVIGVFFWMLSGLVSEPVAPTDATLAGTTPAGSASGLPQVRVQSLQARDITREIRVSGRTEPNRMVELRAETDGTVQQIAAERGISVAEGAAVLTLDMRDREARLREAAALVSQREIEYRAIENLRGQQFTTDIQIAEALSSLESAKAAKERMELEISHTRITAPYAGVVQERSVEIGDFVRVGDSVAQLVDLDPIIISGEVNEREISHIQPGSTGSVVLVDGSKLEGTVRYISRVADGATRTFKVELAVPNPDHSIRAGLTAELRLFADAVRVHTLSSALLSLADDGTVGVKVVDDKNRARFYPVEIVGSSIEGMHITGLPDAIRLITVGQGYVSDGQEVQVATATASEMPTP